MIEIKTGQWWRRRDGGIVKVFGIVPDHIRDFPVFTYSVESVLVYKTNGKFLGRGDHDDDLIEHLPDCTDFGWVPPPPKPKYEPWTFETMPIAVKVIAKDGSCVRLVTPSDSVRAYMGIYGSITNVALLRDYEQLDGTPCGVLREAINAK